jgi:UDP-2,3-diacylglucosamine pyrophosphatase LpxH
MGSCRHGPFRFQQTREKPIVLDAVIVSDIHLGSANCLADRMCGFLERIAAGELLTARLILNGDVFDSIDFRRLVKPHWKVLSLLRKLSDRIDIIWLAGNHDGSAEIVSHLLGVTVANEYVLESGGQKILVLHGHVFDMFITSRPWTTWLGDQIYRFLQWLDRTHAFARMVKKQSKVFLRCSERIADGAVRRARQRDCQAVICGHTHDAVVRRDQAVAYYNSGCWTELPCTYLSVQDGRVELYDFEPQAPAWNGTLPFSPG